LRDWWCEPRIAEKGKFDVYGPGNAKGSCVRETPNQATRGVLCCVKKKEGNLIGTGRQVVARRSAAARLLKRTSRGLFFRVDQETKEDGAFFPEKGGGRSPGKVSLPIKRPH